MRERKSGPQSSRCVFCFSFFNVKLVNHDFQGRVVREKSTAIQRGAPRWDANPPGDTGGMHQPQYDQSLHPAFFKLITVDSPSSEGPHPSPVSHEAVGRVPNATSAGPLSAGFSQARQSQAAPQLPSVPRYRSVGIPVLPAPPYPPAATSIDICCSSTPGKHHMLTLVGNGSLPPRLQGKKTKRDTGLSPGQAQFPKRPLAKPFQLPGLSLPMDDVRSFIPCPRVPFIPQHGLGASTLAPGDKTQIRNHPFSHDICNLISYGSGKKLHRTRHTHRANAYKERESEAKY